jgi:hypothetical protein
MQPPAVAATNPSIVLDVGTGQIATFTPQTAFTVGETYTATIIGGVNGVKDLAIPANEIASDLTWTFTAGSTTQCGRLSDWLDAHRRCGQRCVMTADASV